MNENRCRGALQCSIKNEKNFNLKKEKGITLIALIITIIILVILAAVSIRAAYNTGIIDYGINGTQKYAEEGKKEKRVLSDTEEFMKSMLNKINNIGESNNELADGELALEYEIEYGEYAYVCITPKLGGIEIYEDS